ncbi:phosphatidate cytidylyltransferase [Methylonatrum kenyense]|uniref:phosphatidate cytidylyltransferase n=1 Tax=Methylonatrum kenyense TaxID=455253 RepID=UPI0020C089CB|nr:phosphatidate cytidylyltransferase [Methylonatrum kenyense]
MLSHRIVTALVLLPPFLAAVFLLPTAWFAAVIGLVVMLGVREWLPMIGLHRASVVWAVMGLLAGLMALVAGSVQAGVVTPAVLLAGAAWWLLAPLLLWHYSRHAGQVRPMGPGVGLVVGLLLLLPSWTALVWLHGQAAGPWLVLLLFLMTWMADVGAYFAGRRFGRHRLAPAISPGKTWEGFTGGVLLALLSAVPLWHLVSLDAVPLGFFLLLVLVAIVYSVVGDLFESMVKRRAGLKDSGALLPGHGGVLDRIDSITASATIFAAGLFWLWL